MLLGLFSGLFHLTNNALHGAKALMKGACDNGRNVVVPNVEKDADRVYLVREIVQRMRNKFMHGIMGPLPMVRDATFGLYCRSRLF
jgi:hypothetical protein